MKKPFIDDDKRKKRSREDYVDNECGSDEYRETQPEKGLHHIANAIKVLSYDADDDPRREQIIDGTITWLQAYAKGDPKAGWSPPYGAYSGNEELGPILEMVHDILWEHDEHPYSYSVEELVEFQDED